MKVGRLFAVTMVVGAIGAVAWAGPATAATGPIAGTVTNQSAQPLEGVEVCTWVAVNPIDGNENCAKTDAAGEYSIPGSVSGSKVRFVATKTTGASYAPQWFDGVSGGAAHAEEATPVTEAQVLAGVDAVLAPGARIRGTVLSTATSAPVAGLTVCPGAAVSHEGDMTRCAQTEGAGTFALSNLAPGSYKLEFTPDEGVNIVAKTFAAIPVGESEELVVTAHLVPGVEVTGTVDDAATGQHVVWPSEGGGLGNVDVCGLSTESGERVKCAQQQQDGEYALAGLPAGGYVISYGEDFKEEGVVVHADGYVRQYWRGVPTFEEADWIIGGAGAIFEGHDATLTKGAEVWPGEEPSGEELLHVGSGEIITATLSPPFGGTPIPSGPAPFATITPHRIPPKVVSCKKGFRRVVKGGTSRCVKINKKPKKHHPKKHHAKKAAHR
jgi:hypothetical protein